MPAIRWRDWCDEAFEEARTAGRPVLLLVRATWCRFCQSLEEQVFQDAAVVEDVERLYVPVRVDKDRRPEIDQRYNLGGWPTVAFLTPDGDLITGGSSLTHDEVRGLVERVAGYFEQNREQILVDVQRLFVEQEQADKARVQRRGEFSAAIVDRVAKSILEAFDRRHGGFGTGQKFPHPEAIDFAIVYYAKTRDPAFQELVEKTLSAMADGRLFDPVAGGFFRYCGTRDWRRPHTEKLLETQGGLLRNYLEADQLFDRPEFRKVARTTLDYLEAFLSDDESGGWFGSQDADDEFYALDEERRRDRKAPRVERTCYTPSVAATVSSLLKAGAVLGDEAVTARALRGVTFLVERCFSPGRGMYHYYDGNRHILGLLIDQIYTARALLHAVQFTADNQLLEVVEDLIGTILQKQAATHGGFYDISEDDAKFGSMRRRHTSLLENGLMAEVLVRAHCLTAKPEYLEIAEKTLRAFAADYPLYGYFTAGYARAVELYFFRPVHVVVVGPRDDPACQEMLKRARQTYVPSKVVQAIDPVQDAELLARHGFPAATPATTYLCLARSCVSETRDPDAVADAMMQAEEQRSGRNPSAG